MEADIKTLILNLTAAVATALLASSYIPASDAEVAAILAEAEAQGLLIVCVAKDTRTGCA
jgi:hypothetical protein